jgi:hypothetical protein
MPKDILGILVGRFDAACSMAHNHGKDDEGKTFTR